MGRKRKSDPHLPARLFHRHGGYFYVSGGVWEPLGRDEKVAIEIADRLNRLRHEDRVQALGAARNAMGALRDEIMARDGYKCVYCGSTRLLGLDHIIPYVAGGATLPFNLVAACVDCNYSKGMGDPRELILSLMGFRAELLTRAIDLLDKSLNIEQEAG